MGRRTAKADVIPVRQQNQYNCVTTSLCMALRALGVPEDECSPARVNKVVGAMPLRGAAWEPMLAAANHYGMRATLTLPSTVRQLKSWTDAGKPVVIAWNPEGREWSHASLVFDVDDDLNVHIADPNIPDPDETVRVVPKSEFYGKWYEKSPQGFLIRRPACVIEREITSDGRQVMASRREAKELDTLWMVTEPTEDSEIIDILVGVSNWNTLRNIMVGSPDWRKRKPSFHDDLRSAKADAMGRLFRLWGRDVPDWVMRSSQGDFRMASQKDMARRVAARFASRKMPALIGDAALWSGRRKPTPSEVDQVLNTPWEEWTHLWRPLPDDLYKYFKSGVRGAMVVPLKSLTPIRAREKGIANANRFMWLAYWGEMDRRKPISLRDNGDGTFTVLDGNSTFANAQMSGWKGILGKVEEV